MWFDWVIFALVAFFVLSSLFMIFCGILGVYRMKYVLNRMNAAALIDTLALLFMNIGLMIANGFTFTSLKLFLIVLVMWLTSPISGHLISKLEYVTNKKIEEEIIVDEEEKVEC